MHPVVHTLVIGVISYLVLIVIIRLSGKRTLSKWNAFDFVVTIALGSTLSTALVSTQVSLAQSITAFVLIVALQFAITFTSVRSRRVKNLVKSQPTLLLFQGRFRAETMAQERVVDAEVRAAIRENGIADVERVYAVVLETDGTFSVIPEAGDSDSALQGVAGLPTS
ncbi:MULTISPECIES: DUF421 domain-containing protein [Chromohalobacter]|jgi:uncharacterized membrane protein YcaP (DUF421 family)|uniref:DUF421 domain-containing protein n=1 Tax=Chromohalobacter israelensis (strain ATCC BAA-138 / DSM 3043 / CIP 106854 / NCIMB 13768 / 1H11) TaxID=290398 RepID=Q1R1D2_CHRI1|nr:MULTISPECIES: YetF domain-containing protein [Chromohalobacter]ABE57476.1 conserved hypothetical protein [Chromohalobacter salexigens DSM 3043]MBZ5876411.1 DUF421 domain-containing protein [Chromohalobacter salexigens]MDF9434997.1 DUF421 domain-containing protein [Chromohalobacter israelensis]MDO0945387.1 DUF421 domain-containing protein [Chromohalobacter salexigens]NQY45492.1 DUF421 domain-containing protein [Chromohalobacter sp.]